MVVTKTRYCRGVGGLHVLRLLGVLELREYRRTPNNNSQVNRTARQTQSEKQLFVGSEFRRLPPSQIRYLRATLSQGFWAGHEDSQS